jgi:Putative bacterial sensory transduction regulator
VKNEIGKFSTSEEADMSRLGRRVSLVAITAGALLTAPGLAPALAAQEVVSEVSTEQLRKMLESMGYEVEQPKDDMLQFAIEGHTALIVNKKTNIQFYSYFKKQKKMDLKKVNEWNATKRFSRAYLDKDGDAVIEWDVDLEGGTTAGALKESIRTYRLGVMAFVRFLNG